jgi:hypothetical protein
VQYVNGVTELGDEHHPKDPRNIANSNLLDPVANGIDGLPVIRLMATLDPVKLKTRLAPSGDREGAKVIERSASELDGLGIGHGELYEVLYIEAIRGEFAVMSPPPSKEAARRRLLFPKQ